MLAVSARPGCEKARDRNEMEWNHHDGMEVRVLAALLGASEDSLEGEHIGQVPRPSLSCSELQLW